MIEYGSSPLKKIATPVSYLRRSSFAKDVLVETVSQERSMSDVVILWNYKDYFQKISFDNFNEGTQFKNTIYKVKGLTKTKIKIVGTDTIYATNMNKVFAASYQIRRG